MDTLLSWIVPVVGDRKQAVRAQQRDFSTPLVLEQIFIVRRQRRGQSPSVGRTPRARSMARAAHRRHGAVSNSAR